MSGLGNCPACWNVNCECGATYESWSIRDLEEKIQLLQRVLEKKVAAEKSNENN